MSRPDGGRTTGLRGSMGLFLMAAALTRFYYEFDWNGEPLLLQSRVQDETGYVQPSKAELRKIRGVNSSTTSNGDPDLACAGQW